MGPVNLMAESEAAELEARIADLQRERADLTEAIAGCAAASLRSTGKCVSG